ncbi:NAD(P)-binding protein [Mycena sp. CBHHK59/15]|nr:NAD(P)-binding protein [Mycena sp. CBHHK59/15]
MSLLCLSASNVAHITSNFSPSELQVLMANVFSVLSRNDGGESPAAYTPHRITIPTQNHTALFMPARIARPTTLRGTTIKVVCVPTSPADQRGLPASTLVLDEDSGAVKAIVNAASLTALRNAAGSLLSSNLVGPRAPTSITAFGAGNQIAAHLDLHLRAFPSIRACTIVNRSLNERATRLADALRSRFPGIAISCLARQSVSAPNPDPALQDTLPASSLIICATSSTVPLFPSTWVSDGCHIILIGSYKPTMHEVDTALIQRALPHGLLVDSRTACLSEAGELITAGVQGTELVEIGELVSFDADGELLFDPARESLPEKVGHTTGPVTIFKSVGVGLQDVAIACAVVEKAEAMGIGSLVDWH